MTNEFETTELKTVLFVENKDIKIQVRPLTNLIDSCRVSFVHGPLKELSFYPSFVYGSLLIKRKEIES